MFNRIPPNLLCCEQQIAAALNRGEQVCDPYFSKLITGTMLAREDLVLATAMQHTILVANHDALHVDVAQFTPHVRQLCNDSYRRRGLLVALHMLARHPRRTADWEPLIEVLRQALNLTHPTLVAGAFTRLSADRTPAPVRLAPHGVVTSADQLPTPADATQAESWLALVPSASEQHRLWDLLADRLQLAHWQRQLVHTRIYNDEYVREYVNNFRHWNEPYYGGDVPEYDALKAEVYALQMQVNQLEQDLDLAHRYHAGQVAIHYHAPVQMQFCEQQGTQYLALPRAGETLLTDRRHG